jgi:hypothetical protein
LTVFGEQVLQQSFSERLPANESKAYMGILLTGVPYRWPREMGMEVAPFEMVWQTSAHGRGSERHRSGMP